MDAAETGPKTRRQRAHSRRKSRKSIAAFQRLSDVTSEDPLKDKLEEVFHLFDSGDKGEIDSRELGTVIRALGCVVTEEELQQIKEEIEDHQNSCIPQDRFNAFMTKSIGEQKYKPADADVLLEAFKLFDPLNTGYVMRQDLEKAMTELGEPFTPEELHDMMHIACDPKTGRIYYEHYLNLLLDHTPKQKTIYHLYEQSVYLEKLRNLTSKVDSDEEV